MKKARFGYEHKYGEVVPVYDLLLTEGRMAYDCDRLLETIKAGERAAFRLAKMRTRCRHRVFKDRKTGNGPKPHCVVCGVEMSLTARS